MSEQPTTGLPDLRPGDAVEITYRTTVDRVFPAGFEDHHQKHYTRDLASISITRPALVAGDLVEWFDDRPGQAVGSRRRGTVAHDGECSGGAVHVTPADDPRGNACVKAELLTRIAPEPEPPTVEVGTWWAILGNNCVVLEVDGDQMVYRNWRDDYTSGWVPQQYTEAWTRLPGPPEPMDGDVYRLDGDEGPEVWWAIGDGKHVRAGNYVIDTWEVVKFRRSVSAMASLQWLANVGGAR